MTMRDKTMDLFLPNEKSQGERKFVDFEKPCKTSVAFQKNGNKNGKKCEKKRPGSAMPFGSKGLPGMKGRARSWEALRGVTSEKLWSEERNKGDSAERKLYGSREYHFLRKSPGFPSRSSSRCSFHTFEERTRELWSPFKFHPHTKSNNEFSNHIFQNCEREKDLQRIKRSLKLLGFELADFGVCCCENETEDRWKRKQRTPTISTRITDRSISLDSLRTTVKQAWLDDRLDESHRKLLAQAAYEEWYFSKEREIWQKREEERAARMRAKLNLKEDFQRKQEKSEEEFQKWLLKKRQKRKEHETNLEQKKKDPLTRLVKTKEESEKAFIKWKKSKEKVIIKEKMQKKREEEKKVESERQKNERKIIAEKAFQQWKTKLEENEKSKKAKRKQKMRQQEAIEKRKHEEGTKISFQMWKNAKDEERKEKIKQFKEAVRLAREERLAQMEERMYEAEQAFEDWLEKIDLRKQKQLYNLNTYQKNIPWIPI